MARDIHVLTVSAVLMVLLVTPTMGSSGEAAQVDAAILQRTIRIGEPLVFKIVCTFAEPQKALLDPNLAPTAIPFSAAIQVKMEGEPPKLVPLLPYMLFRKDSEGMVYYQDFILFYDINESRLVFDTPGTYTLEIEGLVPPMEITVEERDAATGSPPAGLEPEGFLLLQYGISEDAQTRSKALAQLDQLVGQHPDGKLGRWAAARLGLVYFEALAERESGSEIERLAEPLRVGRKELLTTARSYLAKGCEIDDGFPLREEALHTLASVEASMGNVERAASLRNELALKYPFGVYGRREAQRASRLPRNRDDR